MEEPTRIDPNSEADRQQRLKQIFGAAAELPVADRSDYVAKACGDDRQMRESIEQLLVSLENDDSFLESPAIADAISLFAERSTAISGSIPGGTKTGELIAGTILSSRYRIIGLLGKGGMGEVFKAEDIKLSQVVALKFLPDRLEKDQDALQRFIGEVRTARQVSHPNVCRVFDISEIDGRHFLSMEFIDGDDLSSLLRRIGRLPSERAVEIARQLCVGLAAIHNAGILHRDFKPANVIIDSKGKAMITDFGIAGLEADVERDSLRVGTPAYMSPEQIRGKNVSTRSDIYSLGLVLYEIFTGKQAFSADSIQELIRKHQTETPTNPSEYVKGIDPLVESVIGQCLEKDPDKRPATALHVAMALPGGNPMQIALEAGQTPSPEMVAASPKKGALRPAIALSCLVGGIAMIVFCMFAAMKVGVNNRIPFNKSADVLSERANDIATKLGYTDAPAERSYRFYEDYSYLEYFRPGPASGKFANIESGQPLFSVFVERQSPNNFDVRMAGNGLWTFDPQTISDQRTISLDTRGRLVEFTAVPPQFGVHSNAKADFPVAFQAAELDLGKFKEVSPNWTPPTAFDERKAWEGFLPDNEEIPLRVEAASFNGKIVFFKLIYPWTKPTVAEYGSYTTRNWIGVLVFFGIVWGLIVTAIFLAWKNIRSGSGDRKGAFKISLAIFVLIFLGWFFSMNHVPSFFPELDRITLGFRGALYVSVLTCIMYLALEPIVRRHLPDLIVSWNRLLTGDWRDPLVGRDVLLGTLLGIAHITLIYAGLSAERMVYGDFRLFFFVGALTSLRSWTSGILGTAGFGLPYGLMFICTLAVLFLLFRRRLFAGLVIFVLMTTVEILFFTQSWTYLPFTIAITTLMSLAIARLGLITMVFAQTVFVWLLSTLFTTNFSAWYSGNMLLTLAVIVSLLIYGFYTATAGQKLLNNRLLADGNG